MPFNDTSAFLKTKGDYVTALKAEIKKLKEGELGEFFFYDGIPVNGAAQPVVLLGKVKGSVAKELKSKATTKGIGQCFLEGGTVNITLTTGKAPEAKLKEVFRETKSYGFKVVSADMAPVHKDKGQAAATDLEKVSARFNKSVDDYARVKDNFDKSATQTVDTLISKIDTAIKGNTPDVKAIGKAVTGLENALSNLIEANPDPKAGAKEKEKVVKAYKALQAKGKKVTAALPQPDKDAITKLTDEFKVLFEAKKWGDCTAKMKEIDGELVKRAKLALATQGASAKTKTEKLETDGATDPEIVQLRSDLKTQDTKLNGLLDVMSKQMAALEKPREDLRIENAKATPNAGEVTRIEGLITAAKQRVTDARKLADKERKAYHEIADKLAKKEEAATGTLTKELEEANTKITALEEMLDDPSIAQAQSQLKDTIAKMGDATAWREERLKEEAASDQHGTGRHGAQTGLERQARRAATTEMETDSSGRKSAKRGTGITPDQRGNVSGTAQREVWNEVAIEYTEEDGRRVIKDRKKVAHAIAGVPARTLGSDTGSMWATPVLEKLAFDTANAIATGLKDHPEYKKSRGYGDFKKLTVVLPAPKDCPGGSDSVGWGYAVTKNDDTPIAPADAEKILQKFEDGKISMSKLFDEMNVKLLSDSDGRNMVRHATCVFTRDDTSRPFKLLTQYPNNKKGASDVGWKPHDNASGTLQFKKDGDAKLWDAVLSKIPLNITRSGDDA